jgi:hypothetical protein
LLGWVVVVTGRAVNASVLLAAIVCRIKLAYPAGRRHFTAILHLIQGIVIRTVLGDRGHADIFTGVILSRGTSYLAFTAQVVLGKVVSGRADPGSL